MLFCIAALIGFQIHMPVERLVQPWPMAMLLGVGITATIGQIFLTKAFTVGVPAKVSVVGLTQIVLTLIVDVCLFNQEFTPLNLLGIALVLAPTVWVMLRERDRGVEGGLAPKAEEKPLAA